MKVTITTHIDLLHDDPNVVGEYLLTQFFKDNPRDGWRTPQLAPNVVKLRTAKLASLDIYTAYLIIDDGVVVLEHYQDGDWVVRFTLRSTYRGVDGKYSARCIENSDTQKPDRWRVIPLNTPIVNVDWA